MTRSRLPLSQFNFISRHQCTVSRQASPPWAVTVRSVGPSGNTTAGGKTWFGDEKLEPDDLRECTPGSAIAIGGKMHPLVRYDLVLN